MCVILKSLVIIDLGEPYWGVRDPILLIIGVNLTLLRGFIGVDNITALRDFS